MIGIAILGGDFITAGQSFSTAVALFQTTDSTATAANFSASIAWDSSDPTDITPGTIIQGANDPMTGYTTFYVIGTHTYDIADLYNFTVYVSVPGLPAVASAATEADAYAPTRSLSPPRSPGRREQRCPSLRPWRRSPIRNSWPIPKHSLRRPRPSSIGATVLPRYRCRHFRG